MQIESESILLNVVPNGENAIVATVFSKYYGKLRGFVKVGRKKRADYQQGNIIQVSQKKRLEHQLGNLTAEVVHMPAVHCFDSMARLQTLHYVMEVINKAFEEGDSHPKFYEMTHAFLLTIAEPGLWKRLAFWELELLQRIGYGLSLHEDEAVECAENSPLMYVSPKSGRAVPEKVGEPYRDKLFRLPHLFGGKMPKNGSETADFLDVFDLTGHFLTLGVHNELSTRMKLMELGRESNFKE